MSEKFAGKTILVVDDDPDILTAITVGLEETSATVLTASDGNKAVRLAEEKQPDLVILDIMLPQKSGFLVLEKLRQFKSPLHPPKVMMITGNQGKRHEQYASALGVDAYIHKPFHLEQILDTAEKLIG